METTEQAWSYAVAEIRIEEVQRALTLMGADGWELVAAPPARLLAAGLVLIFKRPGAGHHAPADLFPAY